MTVKLIFSRMCCDYLQVPIIRAVIFVVPEELPLGAHALVDAHGGQHARLLRGRMVQAAAEGQRRPAQRAPRPPQQPAHPRPARALPLLAGEPLGQQVHQTNQRQINRPSRELPVRVRAVCSRKTANLYFKRC